MRVLILGGGFGGISAARRLRELLDPKDEIVLVDRRDHFFMGFRKIMAIIGREPLAAGTRKLDDLIAQGIKVVRGNITRIDPAAKTAEVDGTAIDADALVVALGADLAPQAVPGLSEHGINVYDESGVGPAADALASASGGRLVVGIFGAPYKCAPAPYELAILAHESAAARGAALDVTVFTPQPMSLPVLGRSGCDTIEGKLAGHGITFRPNTKAERVQAGSVALAGGGEIGFEILFAIPPHRCPQAVVEAGLAEPGGWVKVDPRTLETGIDGVYALGDVVGIMMSNGQPFPKAGVLAENEGRVVADRIAARAGGRTAEATFDGRGACFLEVGNGEAMLVRGDFLADPAPDVELTAASKDNVAEKHRYESDRLSAWFG